MNGNTWHTGFKLIDFSMKYHVALAIQVVSAINEVDQKIKTSRTVSVLWIDAHFENLAPLYLSNPKSGPKQLPDI